MYIQMSFGGSEGRPAHAAPASLFRLMPRRLLATPVI